MGFFKPLRRKFGVVTLVMACVFACGWVRSVYISEVVSSLISDQTQVFMNSTDGMFWCGRFIVHDPGYFSSQPTLRWVQYDDNKFNREDWELSWYWCFSDGGMVAHSSGTTPQNQQYDYFLVAMMPYWSIVIPMTLLSAYLLLSKPRQSVQKKIVELRLETTG